MAVHCEKCGVQVASRAALPGHYRRAHGGARRSVALVPARPKPEPIRADIVEHKPFPSRPPGVIQAEVLDVSPPRSEIVRAPRTPAPPKRSPRHTLTLDLRDAERPPDWWETQADEDWRVRQWNVFDSDYRNRLLAQRADAAFTIHPPNAPGAVILWSQYHALKALATRLDAGIGPERERVAFEVGLREYDANYDRIRAQRKS